MLVSDFRDSGKIGATLKVDKGFIAVRSAHYGEGDAFFLDFLTLIPMNIRSVVADLC